MASAKALNVPLSCTKCGQPLMDDGIECRSCYPVPPEQADEDPGVRRLYRQARRGMVGGSFVLPEIFESFAWYRATQAIRRYHRKGLDDPLLLRQLKRTRRLSIGIFLLGIGTLSLWVVALAMGG